MTLSVRVLIPLNAKVGSFRHAIYTSLTKRIIKTCGVVCYKVFLFICHMLLSLACFVLSERFENAIKQTTSLELGSDDACVQSRLIDEILNLYTQTMDPDNITIPTMKLLKYVLLDQL